MKNVVALVLAGGITGDYGVLTQNRAKGALTVAGNYRVIDFALSNLVNSEVHNIGLIIQYLPGSLIEHVGSGQPWDLDNYGKTLKIMPPFVGVEHTAWYKGTADAIRKNLNFVREQKAEHVIILSGEHVFHMDFRPAVNAHVERNADLTVVTRQLPSDQQRQRYGYVLVDDDGRITEYQEKPATPPSDIAATGIYIFKTSALIELLDRCPAEHEQNLAKDVIEPYAGAVRSFEYRLNDCWEYLENVRDYYNAHYRLMAQGSFEKFRQWNLLTNLKFRHVGHAPAASFGKGCRVESSMISPRCDIQGIVENSILSPGVTVAKGALVSNSILLHDCHIGEGAILEHVVADRDAIIGPGAVIGKLDGSPEIFADDYPLTLIGKGAHIGDGVVITPGRQVCPGQMLPTQDAANLES